MLADFLASLFDDGAVTFREPPPPHAPAAAAARTALARAFQVYRLDIAGPLLDFDTSVGFAAAEFVWRACWYLVHRDAPAGEVTTMLKMPPSPRMPSEHLSADLTFRHLPQLHRRSRAMSQSDVLTTTLTVALRAWPLSGVASDVEDAPTIPVDFGGHLGLEMLYAERYAKRPRATWMIAGRIAEWVELLQGHTAR